MNLEFAQGWFKKIAKQMQIAVKYLFFSRKPFSGVFNHCIQIAIFIYS